MAQIKSNQVTDQGEKILILQRPIQNIERALIQGAPIRRLGSFEEGENIVRVAFSTNTCRSHGAER